VATQALTVFLQKTLSLVPKWLHIEKFNGVSERVLSESFPRTLAILRDYFYGLGDRAPRP